jgi:hypothetical protein
VAEAAIDDLNSEILGYIMERLFAESARNAIRLPIRVKKTAWVPCCRRYAVRSASIRRALHPGGVDLPMRIFPTQCR